MNAGEFLFSRINGATSAAERVYPLILPQAPTYPAISYQEVSTVRMHAMGQDAGLSRVRVQVNAWGKTYADARTLANEVLARISRYRDSDVLDVLLDNELTTYESDTDTRRVIQDYTLFLTNA